jgi:hypothetical protein
LEWHGPLPDSNYLVGRYGYKVDAIVLHTMVGWISAADRRFKNWNSYVSANYGVRVDGSIWQWVSEDDTAYHAGDWIFNLTSVGIEHEDGGDYMGVRPDVLYASSASLVAAIAARHGVPLVRARNGEPGIYDHRDIVATACPDALDTDRIIRQAAALGADMTPEEVDARIASYLATKYGPKLEVELDQRKDDTIRAAVLAVSKKLSA